MRARFKASVCTILAAATIAVFLPMVPAGAGAPSDPDLTSTVSGLARFEEYSRGFADVANLSTPLPFIGVVPASPAGFGFADLFKKAVTDRVPSDAIHFSDLAGLGTGGSSLDLGGRHVDVDATVTPAVAPSTVETLQLEIHATREVTSGLTISNASPLVELHSAGGVTTELTLDQTFTFAYDTATAAFWLVRTPATPALTVAASSTIEPPYSVDAAIGLAKVVVKSSTFHLDEHLVASFADPNNDGKLAFAEPAAGGTAVPGELETADNAAALTTAALAPSPVSTVSGSIGLDTAPSTIPGLVIPSVAATVTVSDPDLAAAPPPTITATGFDLLNTFQRLTPKDVATGLAKFAVAIHAIESQQLPTAGQGDVSLPFMHGHVSDVVQAEELVEKFLADNVDDNGEPKYGSIQDLFAKLSATTTDGATLGVQSASYDATSKKLVFTVVGIRTAAAGPRPLDPALGSANDPGVGRVEFGDSLRPTLGLTAANAGATQATATADPDYVLNATLVLDLQDPKKGTACSPTCPYVETNPADNTNTVVTEQPKKDERFLLRTGGQLLTANAAVHSPIVDTGAQAGFVGVALGGTGAEVTVSNPAGQSLVDIKLKPNGDTSKDVTLPGVFKLLQTNAAGLLDYTNHGSGTATFKASVPGSPDFFPAGTGAALSMPNISAPATFTVAAPDLAAALKPLDYAGAANPKALLGKTVGALSGLSSGLRGLGNLTSGTAKSDLGSNLQVLGQPFSSYLGTPELDAALKALTDKPPDNIQALASALAPVGAVTFSIDPSTSPPTLVAKVPYQRSDKAVAPSKALGFTYDTGGGARPVTGTGPGGVLPVQVTSKADVALAIPLDATNAMGTSDVKVLPTSTVTINPQASVSGASFTAAAGAFSLTLGSASDAAKKARIKASPSLTLAVPSPASSPKSIADWATSLTSTLGGDAVDCPQGG
ncbi:MAG TPA: hypothetical protein VF711_03010, partial [Acidimicrobiales bacterium]